MSAVAFAIVRDDMVESPTENNQFNSLYYPKATKGTYIN